MNVSLSAKKKKKKKKKKKLDRLLFYGYMFLLVPEEELQNSKELELPFLSQLCWTYFLDTCVRAACFRSCVRVSAFLQTIPFLF